LKQIPLRCKATVLRVAAAAETIKTDASVEHWRAALDDIGETAAEIKRNAAGFSA
jgi:hypothetical protein